MSLSSREETETLPMVFTNNYHSKKSLTTACQFEELYVSISERYSIKRVAQELQHELASTGYNSIRSRSLAEMLPLRIKRELVNFRDDPQYGRVMLFRNWMEPCSLVATPKMSIDCVPLRLVGTEAYILLAGAIIGDIAGFKNWCGGAPLQNVFPILHLSQTQSGSNAVELALHTELPFRPDTPRVLLLLCIRVGNDSLPSTFISDIAVAAASLGDKRLLLRDHSYYFTQGSNVTRAMPIERVVDGGCSRFEYADFLVAEGEHGTVLRDLKDAISSQKQSIVLSVGDLLILDNTRICHGRTPFRPRYDGSDRWLQRTLAR